jgi:cystathionine beta-lyase
MKYNFDEIIPRRNSNSCKWDAAAGDDILPMWVADMDFRTAPPVIAALEKRVRHGIFGYTKVPDAYYDALTGWFERQHNFIFDRKQILYTTGVVPALSAIIRALTVPGEKVVVQTPVYHCFFSSIRNNGCEIVSSRLVYKNGFYSVDFDDLDAKTSDPAVKLFLLCSPHNPVGRVWSREELMRMGRICLKNNVTVISDEIHCDLIYPGRRHIPFASVHNDLLYHSITCTAPGKTFNLAGLQVANILAANDEVRMKINDALNVNEVCEINPFAVEALIAAYNEGENWFEELKKYLYGNYLYLKYFFGRYLPQFPVLPLEATYLVWIDCSVLQKSSTEIAKILLEKENLWVNEGAMYGEGGEDFIRLNIACPRALLTRGLDRIRNAFG